MQPVRRVLFAVETGPYCRLWCHRELRATRLFGLKLRADNEIEEKIKGQWLDLFYFVVCLKRLCSHNDGEKDCWNQKLKTQQCNEQIFLNLIKNKQAKKRWNI